MRGKNEEYFKLIVKYIDEQREKNGVVPTVREIEEGIGLPKTTVNRYLAYMRDQGMIEYTGHRNIMTWQARRTKEETVKVPVLGVVSCGIPLDITITVIFHSPKSLKYRTWGFFLYYLERK